MVGNYALAFVPSQGGFIGPTATLLAAVVAAMLALSALRVSAAVNLRNKRVDVISACNQRYDALAQTKTSIIRSIASLNAFYPTERQRKYDQRRGIRQEIALYHRRYWGLKSDQIDYWLAGYIDPETLISWFMSAIDSIQNPVDLWRDFSETSSGGWASVKKFHETTNPRLFQVAESISQPTVRAMSLDMRYAHLFKTFRSIEQEELSLISMLTQNNHRRLSMRRFKSKLPVKIAKHVAADEIQVFRASLLPSTVDD